MSAAAPAQPESAALISTAWAAQARWTVLDTGFGSGHAFLNLWQHWRTHVRRPARLHYVGVLSAEQAQALPAGLADTGQTHLAHQCHDLEPGFHRLLLDNGQLSLTLCVGDTDTMLARQAMQADSLLLTSPPAGWDKWQIKALARCCRRGAELLFCEGPPPPPTLLADAGFQSNGHALRAVYAPHWPQRPGRAGASAAPAPGSRCAVIGAGMAGASVARALALRGLLVDVYDTQPQVAGGASGLPVGLVVPHHSADDSPRSRMSRQGTRLMLQHASELLLAGQDWNPSGVLELAIAEEGLAEAEAELLSRPGAAPVIASKPTSTGWARAMAYGATQGLWHPYAAWVKPARLVQRWLEHSHIAFHGQAAVHSLERACGQWILRDAQGLELGRAAHVVLANAHACVALAQQLASQGASAADDDFAWLPGVLDKLQAMQHVRGTLSYGPCPEMAASASAAMPAFPVNGHGSLVWAVPTAQGPHWCAGSTFQSDASLHADLAREHAANLHKLQALLPAVAQAVAPQFASDQVQAWQGSRCISHDRLPLVGPLQDGAAPTLWLCAGMGARGLSFSALCAELLAAWLFAEPLPLESTLAKSLSTARARRVRPAPTAPAMEQ